MPFPSYLIIIIIIHSQRMNKTTKNRIQPRIEPESLEIKVYIVLIKWGW
jgi:hypothetical protein